MTDKENVENKNLTGSVFLVSKLSVAEKEEMFRLMNNFYMVEKDVFFADLNGKTNAVLLRDESGVLRGFTSVAIFDLEVSGKMVKILFSGDTIVHPDFWGSLELVRVWGRFMYDTLQACEDCPLYWFLISSGYRTYRFLPAYFLEFFPRYDKSFEPALKEIMDRAADKLFGENYCRESGIIRLDHPTPLRQGIVEVAKEKLNNPHTAFFLDQNPGHNKGDELACITRLHWDNFKPFVKRLLRDK